MIDQWQLGIPGKQKERKNRFPQARATSAVKQ